MQPNRRPWSDFASYTSTTHTKPQAHTIHPDELVDMAQYRKQDRSQSGSDVLQVCVAYAQDTMIYDDYGRPCKADAKTYASCTPEQRVNKFGKAYRDNAKLWLHQTMADVVVDAAVFLYRRHGWISIIYDGLRTVDGAYNIYCQTEDSILESGILSAPGLSAHNKGMAADIVMFDSGGRLVPMGGNFDHLDMSTNSRTCLSLPQEIIENRLKREIAFQHAALANGRLFAPLRSEFWDERFPENAEDHWRVLDSLARCLGMTLLTEQDEKNRRSSKGSQERMRFQSDWELMDYDRFCQIWQKLFDDSELRQVLELPTQVKLPPDYDTVIYHGDYNPLYDRELVASGKHLTDNMLDKQLKQQSA